MCRILRYGIDTHPDEQEHNNMGKLLVIPFEEYRPPTTGPDFSENDHRGSIKIRKSPIPSQA